MIWTGMRAAGAPADACGGTTRGHATRYVASRNRANNATILVLLHPIFTRIGEHRNYLLYDQELYSSVPQVLSSGFQKVGMLRWFGV